MADPQIEQGALLASIRYDSGGNAQIEQGVLLAAVSFSPPEINSQVEQGVLLAAVRRYRITDFATMGPPTDINQTAPYNEIPYPWRA
jgi:hypothetical protein